MINGIIKLTTTGAATGPFYIYSNVDGFTVPFLSNISQSSLLAGYPTDQIPNGTTIIRVKSLNEVCNNYIDLVVPLIECYRFLPTDDAYLLDGIYATNSAYIYGAFSGYEETGVPTTSQLLIKLNIDLTIDNSFNVGVGFNEVVYTGSSIIEQYDGKIIVSGTFTEYQGVNANRIIRLNTDGSRDNTFIIGTGFTGTATPYTQTIETDSLNRIVVTGLWTQYNGTSSNSIIRLNPDGSVDNTFVYGSGFDNTTTGLLINSDNSMYITGYFNSYKGVYRDGLVKLLSDGSVDESFVVGVGFAPNGNYQPVYMSRIAGEDSFYCVGYFTSYKGTPIAYIAKLDKFGNLDPSFNPGTGFDGQAYSIDTVWGNKLFVVGYFEEYNGTSCYSGFIILNADGTVLYSEESLDYYNTPIIIGNNLFAQIAGGCMSLLFTFLPDTTTTTTTVAPTTTTTTTLGTTTTTTTVAPLDCTMTGTAEVQEVLCNLYTAGGNNDAYITYLDCDGVEQIAHYNGPGASGYDEVSFCAISIIDEGTSEVFENMGPCAP